ncbi:hypothetical protein [Soonwooa sp.]|uniref:hypothetical protein n=1 Tax=Soonwooa sp. TaxID=1938592 RepID=UPI0028ADC662|nr:hypothetical protein [Soonwooa sp.]
MKIKIFFLLIKIFAGSFCKAQGFALNVGYNYIGKNAGFAGVDYRISDTRKPAVNVGAGTYLTSVNHKFGVVPEIHFNQVVGRDSAFMYQVSLSSKNLRPSLGINIFNFGHLDLGYSFGFNKSKDFQGFALGLNFLLGQDTFYDSFKGFKVKFLRVLF